MNDSSTPPDQTAKSAPTLGYACGVPSFVDCKTNAELIAAARSLSYVGDRVLDLSYGHGEFWTRHRPPVLVANDLNPGKGDHHYDVAGSPPVGWHDAFDTVVWDGPYRLNGTPNRGVFDEKFGTDEPKKLQDRLNILLLGVVFASRCVRPGGHVLVKCQDQVAAGRKQQQRRMIQDVGELFGLKWIDELHMRVAVRAQRSQRLSRSNLSTLVVFKA